MLCASGRATPWQRLGAFDHSATHAGVFPKAHKSGDPGKYAFDAAYYGLLGSADATLCPAGDMPWSMRFYEAIMARSIPVLRTRDDQYYSDAERALPFHVLYEQELRAAGGRVPFDASKADENQCGPYGALREAPDVRGVRIWAVTRNCNSY